MMTQRRHRGFVFFVSFDVPNNMYILFLCIFVFSRLFAIAKHPLIFIAVR